MNRRQFLPPGSMNHPHSPICERAKPYATAKSRPSHLAVDSKMLENSCRSRGFIVVRPLLEESHIKLNNSMIDYPRVRSYVF